MKGLALFAILQLMLSTSLLAFTLTAPRQGRGALSTRQITLNESNRRRDHGKQQHKSSKLVKRQQPDVFSRRPSLEYQRALDSLQNNNARNVSCVMSHLHPREQVHLIQELERSDRYEAIFDFLRERQHSIPQTVWQAAMMALSQSPKHHSRVVDLCEKNPHLLSSNVCAALFRGVSSAAEVESLMERLQSLKKAKNAFNTVQVWNAALSAVRQTKDHADNDNWQTALSILRGMKRHGVVPNERTYGHVLYACAQSGQVKIALSLLQEAQQHSKQKQLSPHTWGAVLHACAKADSGLMDAISILKNMSARNITVNTIHVSAFLSSCAKAGRDDIAQHVLECFRRQEPVELPTYNLIIPPVPLDLVVVNTILLACAKAGNYMAAKKILNGLKQGDFGNVEPDVISYNTILSACYEPTEAKEVVKEMRMSRRHRYGAVPPSEITYTHAISSCRTTSNVDMARFFLESARDDGIEPNVYMYSSAIWSCGNNPDAALEFLEELRETNYTPNVVSYNGVISALATQGRAEEALSLLEEMKDKNLKPNRITFQKLASAIRTSTENIAKSKMLQHILTLMSPYEMRADVGGPILEALIRQYGAGGRYSDASHVFEQIQGPVDAGCLQAMMYACAAGEPPRWEDALNFLHTSDIVEGTRGPAKVDSKALSYAMIACAKADQWEEALNLAELYGRAMPSNRDRTTKAGKSNGAVTLPAFNALMAACGRCGQPGTALRLLNDMEPVFGVVPNEQSYRTVIIACNQAEHDKQRRHRLGLDTKDTNEESFLHWWECALSLLRRMNESKLRVDPQTYSSVISACEAAGQWQRALGVLQTMMKTKGKEGDGYSRLNLYCFNAAISACEKGGAWVEALELYYRMMEKGGTVAPNFVTLSSILVALEKAGQKELAKSTYEEGVRDGIVSPWKMTRAKMGGQIRAMDLHRFSAAMANAAVRSVMESLLSKEPAHDGREDLFIIVGKGKGSGGKQVLLPAVRKLLEEEYGIVGIVDNTNAGRFVVSSCSLQSYVERHQWGK